MQKWSLRITLSESTLRVRVHSVFNCSNFWGKWCYYEGLYPRVWGSFRCV